MHELGENDSSECPCMSLLNEILATSLLITELTMILKNPHLVAL